MAIHKNKTIIDKLPTYIPCETCKEKWIYPEENEDLIDWSIRFHNTINAKLGKWDKWDRTDFTIAQKPTCDICEGLENRYLFPWGFLYYIAESPEFVAEFVSTYPCDKCRNTLITDLPQQDETYTDWIYRNHIRFNEERGLQKPLSLYSPNKGTLDCKDCPDQQ
jgi:hypothetical protein